MGAVQIKKHFNFIDVILMLIGFIISMSLYGSEGILSIFYGWFFATGILFAIRISLKYNFRKENS